jgi:hypothetical protein
MFSGLRNAFASFPPPLPALPAFLGGPKTSSSSVEETTFSKEESVVKIDLTGCRHLSISAAYTISIPAAKSGMTVTLSLPCYSEENQRKIQDCYKKYNNVKVVFAQEHPLLDKVDLSDGEFDLSDGEFDLSDGPNLLASEDLHSSGEYAVPLTE